MTIKRDQGFTLIELLIVVAIISVIAAIAVPGLMRARITGQETSAIVSMKTTNASQVSYSASCGNGAYASSYPILFTPPGGTGQPFISADLGLSATPMKAGYTFTLGPGAGAAAGPSDCNGTATVTGYYATGVPLTYGQTGNRSFATNGDQTVWQIQGPTAPTEPFTAPASPVQ